MIKKLFTLILCVVSMLGCFSSRPMGDVSGATVHKYVHIDPTFSKLESVIITDAFEEWSKKTDRIVKWDLEDWPDLVTKSEVRSEIEIKTGKCRKHIVVMRTFSHEMLAKDKEDTVNKEVLGWAHNNPQECGLESISLVMDRIRSSNELRLVTLHEVGHNLGLKHNGYVSIMNSPLMHTVNGISPYDLTEFCKLWKCDVNKLLAQAERIDAKPFAKMDTVKR